MNRKLMRIIVLMLCVAIGWALGYLRLPFIEKDHSFWLGAFTACSFVVLVLITRVYAREKHRQANYGRIKNWYSGLIPMIIVLALGCAVVWMFNVNKDLKSNLNEKEIELQAQEIIVDSVKSSNAMQLFTEVLNNARVEAASNAEGKLSDNSIKEIVDLGNYLKPFKINPGDSLEVRYSPERGQLLLSLARMNMHEESFAQLRKEVSFANAELRNADLAGLDLSDIDLRNANLADADLSGAKLDRINLSGAQLTRARLNNTSAVKADFQGAEMSWIEMNNTVATGANFDCVNLKNSQMMNADIKGSRIYWANLNGLVLSGSEINGCTFSGVNLSNSNLSKVQMDSCKMRGVDLTDAKLNNAVVPAEWMSSLEDWKISGFSAINARYRMELDTLASDSSYYLRLK